MRVGTRGVSPPSRVRHGCGGRWFLPDGTTDVDEDHDYVIVMNPFAREAVFSITLLSERKEPVRHGSLTDVALRPFRSVAFDLSDVVLGEPTVSALVEVSVGRVAAATLGVSGAGGIRSALGYLGTAPGNAHVPGGADDGPNRARRDERGRQQRGSAGFVRRRHPGARADRRRCSRVSRTRACPAAAARTFRPRPRARPRCASRSRGRTWPPSGGRSGWSRTRPRSPAPCPPSLDRPARRRRRALEPGPRAGEPRHRTRGRHAQLPVAGARRADHRQRCHRVDRGGPRGVPPGRPRGRGVGGRPDREPSSRRPRPTRSVTTGSRPTRSRSGSRSPRASS